MMARNKALRLSASNDFSYIALWQGAGFLLLILLVWFNELVDIPSLFAQRPESPPDLIRGCISTAGVLFAAIITIGHTYVQQRNIVSGMLTLCCYCQKIQINQTVWQRIEEYVGRHSLAIFSHGVCPECFAKARSESGLESGPESGGGTTR